MNELEALASTLASSDNEILVDTAVAARAMRPLQRMLDFNAP